MKSNCIYCDRVFNAELFQVDLFCNNIFVTKYIKICPLCENEANRKAKDFLTNFTFDYNEDGSLKVVHRRFKLNQEVEVVI